MFYKSEIAAYSERSIPGTKPSSGITRAALLRRAYGAVLLVGLALYGNYLFRHASYAVGGADGSGYANIARAVSRGGPIVEPVKELEQFSLPATMLSAFVPLAYTPVKETNAMTPFYPVGVPLHMALGAALAGWETGPYLVGPVAALLSLLLMVLLGLELGLPRSYAMAGSVILGGSATFLFLTLWPMSDVVATLWALAAVFGALRSRKKDAWALLAGAAFGMAFLVRPINVLLLLPVLLCLRLNLKSLSYFVLGGIPLAAIFFGYNTAAYGHPLRTGYGAIELYKQIMPQGFTARFEHYLYWLSMTMSPFLLPGWLGVNFARRIDWRIRAMLFTWFASFLLFFSCYSFYNTWWYTRFLLPGYPALILGALLAAHTLAEKMKGEAGAALRLWGARVALVVLLAGVIGFERYYVQFFNVGITGEVESMHKISTRMVADATPANSFIASMEMSGALKFYTDRQIVRWDQLQSQDWELLKGRAREKNYRFYALLMEHELADAKTRMPGVWTRLGSVRHISFWKVDPVTAEVVAKK